MDIVLLALCLIVFFGGIYFLVNKKKTKNEIEQLKKKEESDLVRLEDKNSSLQKELLMLTETLNEQIQIIDGKFVETEKTTSLELHKVSENLKENISDLQHTVSDLNNDIQKSQFDLNEQIKMLGTNLKDNLMNLHNLISGLNNDIQQSRLDYTEQIKRHETNFKDTVINIQNAINGLNNDIQQSRLEYNEQLRQLVEVLLKKISDIKEENAVLRKKLEYFTEIKEDSGNLNETIDIEKENEIIQNILKVKQNDPLHEKIFEISAKEDNEFGKSNFPVPLDNEVVEVDFKNDNEYTEEKNSEVENTAGTAGLKGQVKLIQDKYEIIESPSIEEQYKKIQENLKNNTVYFTINDSYSLKEYIGTTQKIDSISSLYPNKNIFYCRFAGHSIGNSSIQAFLLKKNENIAPDFTLINTNSGLDPLQEKAYQLMDNTKDNIFISGNAGTGKSFLLRLFCAGTKKRHLIVAPTGIAALNVDGVTIHSAFGYSNLELGSDLDFIKLKSEKKEVLKNIDVLIIDEISMVRADVLDKINIILQNLNQSSKVFGGKQVFIFGDLFQLPPIVNQNEAKFLQDTYGGIFFFHSNAFKNGCFHYIELNNNHRQNSDAEFFNILRNIRKGITIDKDIINLNTRYTPSLNLRRILKLYPKKEMVEKVNNEELSKIEAKEHVFEAIVEFEKDANVTKNKENIFPISFTLKLKLGALIMMVKNDINKRWVNGTLGIISGLDQNHLKVTIDQTEYEIGRESFVSKEAKYSDGKIYYEPVLSVSQYPLILAYAITIHKSQGMTYKNVACDLTDTFEAGQSYVALSRCASLNGLHLMKKITGREIRVSPEVISFCEKINDTTV